MRIDRVELFHLKVDLLRPFETSSSRKTYREHVLVKAHADGLVGWGESPSPSDPYYCPDTTETCWHILKDFLIPSVLGYQWDSIEQLVQCYARVKGHNFAKSGLEMACWDLLARSMNRPLHALLGGTRAEILSGVSLGIEEDIQRLFGLIDQFVGEGYRRVKLKIGPGRDVQVIASVRKRYPDLPLMADANSAYTLRDVPLLKELDQFNLTMIEQPLAHDDIVDHAQLQRELRTPVCLDESIHTAEDARKALDLCSARVINIKVSRMGGLLEARKTHDLCQSRGIPVWCGGMHEYGVGRAANVAISSLPGFVLPGDVSGSDKYYAQDIVDPPILAHAGAIPVPSGPGLGVEVDEGRVREYAVRHVIIEP
jgi:O-succinylbenzoate synthase